MKLLHPSNNTLRRYSLALLGLVVVAAKAAGASLTSEDIALTLTFLGAAIGGSNWREVKSGKSPEPAP